MCTGKTDDTGKYTNTTLHTHHGENHCPNEFETSYAPDRDEIVYCEECYQEEVAWEKLDTLSIMYKLR